MNGIKACLCLQSCFSNTQCTYNQSVVCSLYHESTLAPVDGPEIQSWKLFHCSSKFFECRYADKWEPCWTKLNSLVVRQMDMQRPPLVEQSLWIFALWICLGIDLKVCLMRKMVIIAHESRVEFCVFYWSSNNNTSSIFASEYCTERQPFTVLFSWVLIYNKL